MTEARVLHVLLSAFAISPEKGSESAVGWEFASRLARRHQVTILYGDLTADPVSKTSLETWIKTHPHDAPPLQLVYVPSTPRMQQMERLHSKPGLRSLFYAGYRLWQEQALAVARQLHLQQPFDLVHQLTFATYREPGYLWKLGIPFFWGPFSGGNIIPLQYLPILGLRGSIEALGRWGLQRSTLFTHPRIPQAARKATHLWCVTRREQEILAPYSSHTSLMMEFGTTPGNAHLRTRDATQPLQLVWSGVHVPRKALPLLIRAVAALKPDPDALRIHVLGAGYGRGEETLRARALAEKLGVDRHFLWLGQLARTQALQELDRAHALIHTSLLEATSTVVLEALSSGLPVLCHDCCGMATAVTAECGIKVPATGVEASIRGFAAAIQRLLQTPGLVEELSRGAIERSFALGWDNKIAVMERAYAQLGSSRDTDDTARDPQ